MPKKSSKSKIIISIVALALVAAVAVGAIKMSRTEGEGLDNIPLAKVERGSLKISVDESGTIKALDQEIIKSEVEGRRTILTLVPEGTMVKKGDLLIELDASALEDELVTQQMTVQNAETSLFIAQENLAVGKNQALADTEIAKLDLEFAKQDLEKYVKGEYKNELDDANAQIKVKEEALQQAQDKLIWSEKLAGEKYISQMELKADQLAVEKAKLEVTVAKNKLWLLETYTYNRNLKQYESDVSQAEMALERTNRKAKADVNQLEAELLSAQTKLEHQRQILEKLEKNIKNTRIYAPSDGMVIYATSAKGSWRGNQEPLEEGQEVYERQELIYLPTSDKVKAELKVHESNLEKIYVGLDTTVKVDALPDEIFHGKVAKIGVLPDAQMMFMNPDLKVYTTEIHIDSNGSQLRTGMSCRASMVLAVYKDVLTVPLQSVVKVGKQHKVYIIENGKMVAKDVEIGLDNNRRVHIKSGLEEGQDVVMAPPLESTEARDSSADEDLPEKLPPADMTRDGSGRQRSPQQPGQGTGGASRGGRDRQSQGGQTEGGRGEQRRPGGMGQGQMPGDFDPSKLTDEQKQQMRKRFEEMRKQGTLPGSAPSGAGQRQVPASPQESN